MVCGKDDIWLWGCFPPRLCDFFNTMIETLGTLSLDDKFMFLGGHKVAPNAPKHLVTESTDWSCIDPHVCIVYNLHRAEKTCSSMSSTCPLPTEAGSFFFPQRLCQCVSSQTLQNLSIKYFQILSLTVTLLGANTSGGRNNLSIYPQARYTLFQHISWH